LSTPSSNYTSYISNLHLAAGTNSNLLLN
jgi:hypothetical protein